jgi:hypothetical protein
MPAMRGNSILTATAFLSASSATRKYWISGWLPALKLPRTGEAAFISRQPIATIAVQIQIDQRLAADVAAWSTRSCVRRRSARRDGARDLGVGTRAPGAWDLPQIVEADGGLQQLLLIGAPRV